MIIEKTTTNKQLTVFDCCCTS